MSEKQPKSFREHLAFFDEDRVTAYHDEIVLWVDKNAPGILESIFEVRVLSFGTTMERMLCNGRGGHLGFLDIEVVFTFEPLARTPFPCEGIQYGCCPFEIKGSMASHSLTLRQLQFYKRHWHPGSSTDEKFEERSNLRFPFVVVSPVTTYAALFREQGFEFIPYDPIFSYPSEARRVGQSHWLTRKTSSESGS